jgi:hypothetical protein
MKTADIEVGGTYVLRQRSYESIKDQRPVIVRDIVDHNTIIIDRLDRDGNWRTEGLDRVEEGRTRFVPSYNRTTAAQIERDYDEWKLDVEALESRQAAAEAERLARHADNAAEAELVRGQVEAMNEVLGLEEELFGWGVSHYDGTPYITANRVDAEALFARLDDILKGNC